MLGVGFVSEAKVLLFVVLDLGHEYQHSLSFFERLKQMNTCEMKI